VTVSQCQQKNKQSRALCEALVKGGLRLSEISSDHDILWKGFTQEEHKALKDHYLTPPEPMGECEPGCVLCKSDRQRRRRL
jgi:hypothetical protein